MIKGVLNNMMLRIMLLVFVVAAALFMTGFTDKSEVRTEKMIVVTVEEGESLWMIAGRYMKSGQDIRKLIYEIREANELGKEVAIYPGQQLKIPLSN